MVKRKVKEGRGIDMLGAGGQGWTEKVTLCRVFRGGELGRRSTLRGCPCKAQKQECDGHIEGSTQAWVPAVSRHVV